MTVTSFWADDSIRWALVDFVADVGANEEVSYAVEYGSEVARADVPDQMVIDDTGIALIVIGTVLYLLERSRGIDAAAVFLLVGSAFFAAYLYRREFGYLVAAGILLGLGLAFGVTHVLAALLYGVIVSDPFTYLIVAAVMAGVAFLASYIPARRASRIDPMEAVRYE